MAVLAALDSLYVTLKSLNNIRQIEQSEWDELKLLLRTVKRLDSVRDRGIDRSEINELEAKITDAAWKLQDVVEGVELQLHDEKGVDLEQETRSFFNTANKLREEHYRVLNKEYVIALDQNSRVAVAEEKEEDHVVIHDAVAANSTTVGLSDLSQQIITFLRDDREKWKVITIWGMAGIGKTHLARDIYHHPLVVQHFDFRLWLTIGPIHRDDKIKNFYADILAQIQRQPRNLFKEKNEGELKGLIWNNLDGRTYLIVLDDLWNPSDVKDFVTKLGLPMYNSHLNVLLTTRLFNTVADELGQGDKRLKYWQMPFLGDEESWNLLSRNVFAEESFPTHQLERAGRKIAHLCEGLPLLILTVADILRGLDQTEECWNKVAQRKTTTFTDAYDRIYKVLVSSYDYLLQEYKACFLYMGVFPPSREILASKLIHLWGVEDILGNYLTLKVFVSSSISLVVKHRSDSRIKSCKLHSTYWYVCATEARKNKLFHVLSKLTDAFAESHPRRLSVQNNMLFGIKEVYDSMVASTSLTRSLLFTGEDHQYPVRVCFNTMLLMKVLDALAIRFYEFPNEVLNLLQLRYLTLTHNGEVPSSISELRQLRFLILCRHHNIKFMLESTTCLPNEIWGLKKLRYLRIMGSNMPDPSSDEELLDLSRLYVNADNCTEGVLRGTPSLVKLGIEIELQPEGGNGKSLRCLEHIGLLKGLKSLKCVVVNPRMSCEVVFPSYHLSNLPKSLKKLSLKGMGYTWEYMSVIGKLPHLQVLKLRCFAFRGAEWEMKDGEFSRLNYLLLEDLDVVHWIDKRSFPLLSHLIVRHCYKLKDLGRISDIFRIEVDECSPSLVEYAQQIKETSGYLHLKLETNSSWNL